MAFWVHCGAGHGDKCHTGHLATDQKRAGPEMVIIGGVTNIGTNVQVLWGGP